MPQNSHRRASTTKVDRPLHHKASMATNSRRPASTEPRNPARRPTVTHPHHHPTARTLLTASLLHHRAMARRPSHPGPKTPTAQRRLHRVGRILTTAVMPRRPDPLQDSTARPLPMALPPPPAATAPRPLPATVASPRRPRLLASARRRSSPGMLGRVPTLCERP